ncbi:MAG: citrate lyase acyl carrier protein [Streptococcaceae bacterium]|jgi:citrate lyase subunit gamma (acyl carrier protein)|nr:citrate lyase acyl carrier protein [Streptococcaceae bacterium]
MELKKTAVAGTLESSDLQITISPAINGLSFELTSDVKKQFGDQIIATIEDVLKKYEIENATIQIVDKGALDLVIRARAVAAVERALETEDINWEAL